MDDFNFGNINIGFTNIIYNIDSIINKLKDPLISAEETKNIIKMQHDIIFTYDNLMNGNREGIQELFTSIIFLCRLDSVVGLLNLSKSEIIFINKIIYDYFEFNNDHKKQIEDKLLSISYTINRNRIQQFTPILGVNTSRLLSIVSYSSYKTEKIVHRVNNFIINSDISMNNLEYIYYVIFGYLYNKQSADPLYNTPYELNQNFTNLFCYSMFEYCDSNDPNIVKRFNQISSFLLNKLIDIGKNNYMDFYNILITYNNMIDFINIDKNKLRFSIKNKLIDIKDESISVILDQLKNIEEQNRIEIY